MLLTGVTTVDIISAVSSVGFPIVMCLLIFKRFNDLNDKMIDSTKEISKTIEQNTISIVELKEEIHAHTKLVD